MEIFKMYTGHFGIWFFLVAIAILRGTIKLNGINFINGLTMISLFLSIPSCAIQQSFFN